MEKPYVGITGVTRSREVAQLRHLLNLLEWPPSHQVMIGVLMSDKSMRGLPLKPLWRTQYPDPRVVESLLLPDPRLLNLVHYNTKSLNLARELAAVAAIAPSLAGFQLNIGWPDPREIERYRARASGAEDVMVLQVGPGALAALDYRPVTLSRRLRDYEGLVQYALIDMSGGRGLPFDPEFVSSTLGQLVEADLDLAYGVGGGLDGSNLDQLLPLLELYPALSWDAQGCLRSSGELDLLKCQAYLEASVELVSSVVS